MSCLTARAFMASRDYPASAPESDAEECERDNFDVTIWLNLHLAESSLYAIDRSKCSFV
jgi:hypothetical protein